MKDEQARHVSAVVLRASGYEVTETTTCGETLAKLDEGDVCDILITDFVKQLSSNAKLVPIASGRYRRLSVLLLVSAAQEVTVVVPHCIQLTIPFSGSQLMEAVVALQKCTPTGPILGQIPEWAPW
jgi:DNA-binding NtrC family response regulator